MKMFGVYVSVLFAASFLGACSIQSANQEASTGSAQGLNPQTQSLVSFKLTDAPNESLKSVVVNIDHMEVLVAGSNKAGRLILAQDLGPVDLLKLQNGVTLPLKDVVAPAGLKIQQIRLVLKGDGHFIVKEDDSICALKTPSAQKTGVKIILTNKVQFEAGYNYSVVVDFDAKKSVVLQGNGGCLLKPVLKLKSALKTPHVIPPTESEVENPSEGGDGIPSNGGEELVTEPEQNDPEVDDGWDYTPVVDGQEPIVTEENLANLL